MRAPLFHSFVAGGPSDRTGGAEKCGGGGLDPPPLNHLRTGGGDGCRDEVRWDGDGRRARPLWFEPPAGPTDGGGRAHFDQALPRRRPTNLVAAPHFDRIRRVILPSFCASLGALPMSVGCSSS